MGVTELGRMLGNDPNLALSVLYGLARWETGKSGGGMDQHRRGLVRMGEEGGYSSSGKRRNSSSTLQDRGRDPYGNVPGVGDTRYVPWAGVGNGGSVNQVTVLGDWDVELDPGDSWVVSQGSTREEKGKKGKKRKREKEGGTFRVPGELLFRTPEEAEAHLRAALEERDDGDDGDDRNNKGDEGDDKGEGGDKGGGVRGDKGGVKKGDTGGEKGDAGNKDAPRQPPSTQEG